MPRIILTDEQVADVVDSLRDAAENAENAADAVDSAEAEAAFTVEQERFSTLADAVKRGEVYFTPEQIVDMTTALESSIANCTELDLDDAVAGYQSALDAL